MNFAKFLIKTPIFIEHLRLLLLKLCIFNMTERLLGEKNSTYESVNRKFVANLFSVLYLYKCNIFLNLNVYKLNLLNTAVFMHKIKNRTAPSSFLEKFEQPTHSYPTRFSSGNYRKPQIILNKCRFRISIRGPAKWNNLVGSTEKEIQSSSLFKTKIKRKLLFF